MLKLSAQNIEKWVFDEYAQVQFLLQRLDDKIYEVIIMNVATNDTLKWTFDKMSSGIKGLSIKL